MKYLILLGLLTFSIGSYANIPLVVNSTNKAECSLSNLKTIRHNAEDLKNTDQTLLDNPVAKMQLLNKNNQLCYTFDYPVETSFDIKPILKGNQIEVIEMVGTASTGNWLYEYFKIDLNKRVLILKKALFVSFSMDDEGNIQKSISKWK